jgi:hypothetical protein
MLSLAAAATIEIELIVGTGPALTVVGFALALVARPFRSWLIVGFALSGPAICFLCAMIIARFRLDPSDAKEPIPVILGAYVLIALPFGIAALRQLLRGPLERASTEDTGWRFSLKSLLLLTTATCVFIAIARAAIPTVQAAVPSVGGAAEYFVFDVFNLVTAALIAATVYFFFRG